ncbi:MAG: class I tRNA ligase family protein, partial [Paludibacter sp.]
ILEPLVVLLAPFAPHIAEELYRVCGNETTVCDAGYPVHNEEYLIESSINYPVSFNGKVRFTLTLPAGLSKEELEKTALADENTLRQLNGATIKKVIVVPGKIINIVS